MFFSGYGSLLRTLCVGVLAYVAIVCFLRISGRRTLSKMNAFDFIVTIALGSTLASVLLSNNVSLANGAMAFALLIGLQYMITWSSVRVRWVRQLVTGEPVIIFYQGAFLPRAMRHARVTEDEVRAAARSEGLAVLDAVEAVVLETDGSFSVVQKSESSGTSSLEGVAIPREKISRDG